MKAFLVAILTVCLFLTFAEARPDDDKLTKQAQEVASKIREVFMKIQKKVHMKVKEYFERDGLGEKLKEVVKILLERLSKRMDRYLEKD